MPVKLRQKQAGYRNIHLHDKIKLCLWCVFSPNILWWYPFVDIVEYINGLMTPGKVQQVVRAMTDDKLLKQHDRPKTFPKTLQV